MKKKVSKTLNAFYNILPDNFLKDIGVLYYNKKFSSFIDKYGDKLSQEEKKGTLEVLKNAYPSLKKTVDRAIQKAEPTKYDEEILRKFFSPKPYFNWRKNKKFCLPSLFFKNIWMNLFAKWIFYVWKGDIKVKRCKAKDCPNIFVPNPRGPVEQKYCSVRCRDTEAKRHYRQRKRELVNTQ